MSLVGNLKTVSFSDLLQLISTNKKTGMLLVTRQNQKKSLFFLEGEIVSFISSDQDDWFLSRFLLRTGQVAKKDWERVLLLSKSSGKKITDTLVELGLVPRQSFLDALKTLIEETIFGIFGWEEAEFKFEEGKLPPATELKIKMSTMGMIMEGAKRVDEWSVIQKNLPPSDFSLKLNPKPRLKEGMINLTLDEYQTLLLIDGEKAISEILVESSLGEFSTSKSLSDLISNGLVLKGEKKALIKNKKEEEEILLDTIFQVYHHSFSLVEQVLTQKLGQGKDELLNRFMVQQKKYYPLLGKLFKRNFLEKENFFKVTKEMPKETRLYQLLDSLNSVLFQALKNLHSVLGENIKRRLCDRIRREITPLLEADKSITDKYQLPQEIERALNRV